GLSSSIDTSANANFGGSVFRNNIFTKQVKYGGGAVWSNNINPGTDARFVNPAGGNFQLSSNSPAVNRGAFVSPYTNGYAGSAPDIGALEYGRPAFGAGANLQLKTDSGFVPPPVVEEPAPTPQPTPTPAPTPSPTPAPVPAPAGGVTVQAEAFSAQKGVFKSATNIGSLDNGDWVRYDHVNFGNGVTKVTALLAVPSHADGQTIEVRVGGLTGTLL